MMLSPLYRFKTHELNIFEKREKKKKKGKKEKKGKYGVISQYFSI